MAPLYKYNLSCNAICRTLKGYPSLAVEIVISDVFLSLLLVFSIVCYSSIVSK